MQQMPPSQQMQRPDMSQQNGFDFNSGENFNLDFSTLDNTDVLENFDFDAFLNTTSDDTFNFDSGMIGGDFSVDANDDLPANEGLRKEANHNADSFESNGDKESQVPGEDVDVDGDSEAKTSIHKQEKKRGLLADAPISKPSNDAAWPRTYSVGPTRRRRYYCRVPQCRRKPEGFTKHGYYRNHMTSRHQAFVKDHSDWQEAPEHPLSGVSEFSNEDNLQINIRAAEKAKATSTNEMRRIQDRMQPQLRADLQARGVEPIIYYFRMMATREFRKIQSERQANAAGEHVAQQRLAPNDFDAFFNDEGLSGEVNISDDVTNAENINMDNLDFDSMFKDD